MKATDIIIERNECARTFERGGYVDPRGRPERYGNQIATLVRGAVPYFWARQITDLALASPLPPHTIEPPEYPYAAMWWYFDGEGFRLPRVDNTTGLPNGYAYAKHVFVTRWDHYTGFAMLPEGPYVAHLPVGKPYPPEALSLDGVAVAEFQSGILRLIAFLNSSYVSARKRPPSNNKNALRRLRKAGPVEEVVYVTLRQPKALTGPYPAEERGVGGIDWKHRWMVRGHYRLQPCGPGNAQRKLIWISSFLKGPEDAPLKTPAYRVAR